MEGKYLFLPFSRNHFGCERSFHFSLLNTRDIGSNPPRLILAENLGAVAYLKPYSRAIADMGI